MGEHLCKVLQILDVILDLINHVSSIVILDLSLLSFKLL